MPERRELPDSKQLTKLFRMLIGPEEEWDDASAEVVLKLHGIDPAAADEALKQHLEREVSERRARGEDIPQAMLDALANLHSKAESEDEATDDLNIWLNNLLGVTSPSNLDEQGRPSYLQAFRSRNMDSLSEEDRQILEALAAELRSGEAEEE